MGNTAFTLVRETAHTPVRGELTTRELSYETAEEGSVTVRATQRSSPGTRYQPPSAGYVFKNSGEISTDLQDHDSVEQGLPTQVAMKLDYLEFLLEEVLASRGVE